MATIKEMAELHAPINKGDNWDVVQKQILKQTSFEAGMLAAFEEMERALVYPKNDGQRIMIEKKIKELKGE